MNKQIAQCVKQSGLDVYGLGAKTLPWENTVEQFAQLIAAECANICAELRFTTEGPGEAAAYQRTLCEMAIKENFGLISKGPITAKNIT